MSTNSLTYGFHLGNSGNPGQWQPVIATKWDELFFQVGDAQPTYYLGGVPLVSLGHVPPFGAMVAQKFGTGMALEGVGVTAASPTFTTIWTPQADKRIVLKGFTITAAIAVAVAGVVTITLSEQDNAAFWSATVFAPATTVAGTIVIPVDFGNGKIFSSENTALLATLSVAVTAGQFTVAPWGVEIP